MCARLRDAAFLSIVTLLLAVPLAARGAAASGTDLPKWLDAGSWSGLEGRTRAVPPGDIGLEAFADGSLQSELDQYLSDLVPARDEVLLANAGLQRASIMLANMPRGYGCVPTFYGSGYVACGGGSAVAKVPARSDGQESALGAFARGVAEAAARRPDVRFVTFVVDRSNDSAGPGALGLCSGTWTTQASVDVLREALKESKNVSVVTRTYADPGEYYRDFFRTDHHWNVLGAAEGYNRIAEVLGLAPFDPHPLMRIAGCKFRGSYASRGLCPIEEDAFDTAFDFGALTVLDDEGNPTDEANGHVDFYGRDPAFQKRYFYDCWYGERGSSPAILGPGKGEALLVCDSYGLAMKRILALNYGRLLTCYDLHSDTPYEGQTLESRLAEGDVRDVIFVAHTGNFVDLLGRMPGYFDDVA